MLKNAELVRLRLLNQRIAQTTFETPAEVVTWLGAVQAQDYLGALWAVGLRTRQAAEGAVEQALADRTIVRTWPMRGTLHFVTPSDVHWMLKLLTPRMLQRHAQRQLQQYGIDDATIARSKDLFTSALQGGRQLTRDEMYKVLDVGGIPMASQRGLQILWRVAQEGLICFGPRKGKQQTFVLLDEWVPAARPLERDEALGELFRRYMTSHGPATLQDFVWWSELTLADAKVGLELAKPHLAHEIIDEQTYWLPRALPAVSDVPRTAYLLPNFDEYLVGYRNREHVIAAAHSKHVVSRNGILSASIIWDGQVVGIWKRTLARGAAVITPTLFAPLSKAAHKAYLAAAERYGAFLGVPVSCT
jgi:hypothetical protein